ncbi:uncharacterized protein TNCV_631951 [Trichonephila clavipes]|nr:uncharacterized protein TNCV_631951 [Trichonephila clavipes]
MPLRSIATQRVPLHAANCPPQAANPVKQLLKGHAENARVISHHFPTAFPPKSPDLNLCDFWLRGYLKDAVFSVPTAHLAELRSLIAQHSERDPRDTSIVGEHALFLDLNL